MLIAAAIIGALIVALSLYVFFLPMRGEPFDKDKFSNYKDLFDVVVKSTLLPLFTTLITTNVAYAVAKVILFVFPIVGAVKSLSMGAIHRQI